MGRGLKSAILVASACLCGLGTLPGAAAAAPLEPVGQFNTVLSGTTISLSDGGRLELLDRVATSPGPIPRRCRTPAALVAAASSWR
jgi:hypothetical protein